MKPMPASAMQRPIASGVRSMLTPSAASTSAAPERDDSARLPCLATGTPAPATMSAAQVEMLNEPEASPPVPTTSIASGGAATRSILARIADTAPVISSTVSPRTRNAISSAPICDGVASPDIICSKAPEASSRVSVAPVATLPMSALECVGHDRALNSTVRPRLLPGGWRGGAPAVRGVPRRRDVEKVFQHQMAVIGGDAFGMELHAMHRQTPVREPHDEAVVGIGGDGEIVRQARALDDQRMIARRLERPIDAAKNAGAAMTDRRELAVHRGRRAHHFAAEGVADRLMAEADAEDRNFAGRRGNQIEADAGFLWRAGARREHDGVGIGGNDGGGW